MLEVGFFHADPHPGNLVATDDGTLAYFDFGMTGDIPRHYQVGLIQMVRTSCMVINWGESSEFECIYDRKFKHSFMEIP